MHVVDSSLRSHFSENACIDYVCTTKMNLTNIDFSQQHRRHLASLSSICVINNMMKALQKDVVFSFKFALD